MEEGKDFLKFCFCSALGDQVRGEGPAAAPTLGRTDRVYLDLTNLWWHREMVQRCLYFSCCKSLLQGEFLLCGSQRGCGEAWSDLEVRAFPRKLEAVQEGSPCPAERGELSPWALKYPVSSAPCLCWHCPPPLQPHSPRHLEGGHRPMPSICQTPQTKVSASPRVSSPYRLPVEMPSLFFSMKTEQDQERVCVCTWLGILCEFGAGGEADASWVKPVPPSCLCVLFSTPLQGSQFTVKSPREHKAIPPEA